MEMILYRKQIREIFLFEIKMGCKAEDNLQHQQRTWPRSC